MSLHQWEWHSTGKLHLACKPLQLSLTLDEAIIERFEYHSFERGGGGGGGGWIPGG